MSSVANSRSCVCPFTKRLPQITTRSTTLLDPLPSAEDTGGLEANQRRIPVLRDVKEDKKMSRRYVQLPKIALQRPCTEYNLITRILVDSRAVLPRGKAEVVVVHRIHKHHFDGHERQSLARTAICT